MGHPVERRREVVHKRLTGVDATNSTAQLGGDGDIRIASLDPEQVGVGREGKGALGGGWHAGAEVVEAFASARDVPIEVDRGFGVLGRESAAAADAHVAVLGGGGEVGIDVRLRDTFGFHMGDGSFVEGDEVGGLDPVGLESVDLGSGSTFGLHGLDCFGKGLDCGVGNTEDELVVANINGGRKELAGLRVCAGDHEVLAAHDVPLEARGV